MPDLHLDYESFSACDIKKAGAYRYAADPSTEILMMAVALDKEEPLIYIPEIYGGITGLEDNEAVLVLLKEFLPREDVRVFAHNVQFEIAMSHYLWSKTFPAGVPAPSLSQWRCTAAMSRRAALHGSLKDAAADLDLQYQKDTRGATLIRTFSIPKKPTKTKPSTRVYPWDKPQEFTEFAEYCLQDVRVERAIHTALKPFEPKGTCLEHFQLDIKLNHRGIPVNRKALGNAASILQVSQERLNKEFKSLTGLRQSQRAKCKAGFQSYGYPFDNLQASTVKKALEDTEWSLSDEAVEALKIYSDLSYSAVSKIGAMITCDCGDGYVRGTLQYYGAGTGRWSGKLIQPQNFKRPTIKDTEGAYQMICEGCTAEELAMVHGNPIEVLSSCIRHFLHPHEGGFFQADYAAVEARIVCWLAGQENALEEYRQGKDRYKVMASVIYGIPESQINSDQRWVGKQSVLGCGFQLWWPGFQSQCLKNGVALSDAICENAVVSFRNYHDRVVALWGSADNAAKQAIAEPGRWFRAGSKMAFACSRVKSAGKDFLFLRLPSGRMLAYPEPRIDKIRKKFGTKTRVVDQITFYGQIPNKAKWGRSSTYGGKLVENATQATAADLMANGSVQAERRGFKISTLIHDEALAFAHPTLTIQDFCDALCDLPEWAEGLPLVAEGKEIPFYLK